MARNAASFSIKTNEMNSAINMTINEQENTQYEPLPGAKSDTELNIELGEITEPSKTQLKNEARALVDFARTLVDLPAAKVSQLPLNGVTLAAIKDFHKQSGNIARKRHIAYIGKCLRSDQVEEAKKMLQGDFYAQLRANAGEKNTDKEKVESAKNERIQNLLQNGDVEIQLVVEQHPQVSRQTLRQLVRNFQNAKTQQKQQQSRAKLEAFLLENEILLD